MNLTLPAPGIASTASARADDIGAQGMDIGPFLRQEGRSPATQHVRARGERRSYPAQGTSVMRPSLYDLQVTMRSRSGPARQVTLWMASLVRQIRQTD